MARGVQPHDYIWSFDLIEQARAGDKDAIEKVIKYALRAEGALHRIEEWPGHEEHYPPEQRRSIVEIAKLGMGLYDGDEQNTEQAPSR